MIQFILLPGNTPFTVALLVMVAIAALELAGAVIGGGPTGALESVFGEDVHGLSSETVGSSQTTLSSLLSWLRFRQVPLLVLLLIFLSSFGLSGLALQAIATSVLGWPLPWWLASMPAVTLSLPIVRSISGILARWMPREETDARPADTLIGFVATITTGTARKGHAAEARLRDSVGQTHYVMVEPDLPEDEFTQGSHVLLVRRHGARFMAIAGPHDTSGGD